jgi:hypothetical protein
MLGYLVATIATQSGTCWLVSCWRYPFLLQFMVSLPLGCAAFFVPTAHLDTREHRRHRDRAVSQAQREIEDELTRRLGLLFPGSTEILPGVGGDDPEGTPYARTPILQWALPLSEYRFLFD